MYERIIITVIAVILVPVLTYGVGKLSELINAEVAKIQNAEVQAAIRKAIEAVEQAVLYVMQTYVDSLKNAGKFDIDAQKEAFERAKKNANMLIDKKTQELLADQYGSFSYWLNTRIEQTVRGNKIEQKTEMKSE